MDTKRKEKGSVEMIPDEKTVNMTNDASEEPDYDRFPAISNTVSMTECTGTMYAPPQNEEEQESYQELTNMQYPKKRENEAKNVLDNEI